MTSYHALSGSYDRLTQDIPYAAYAQYYKTYFQSATESVHTVLDLCCGTGSLTRAMAESGYEMISVDNSPEMLSLARMKCDDLPDPPLFICQDAAELDLYGTVDAAFSSLDSINYIPRDRIGEVFRRLSLFIRPGGLLLFDVRTPAWMEQISGFTSVDEDDSLFCIWRSDYDRADACLIHGMDLFRKEGTLWRRDKEEHIEYAYSAEFLTDLMTGHGFELIGKPEQTFFGGEGREFYKAIRLAS